MLGVGWCNLYVIKFDFLSVVVVGNFRISSFGNLFWKMLSFYVLVLDL